MTKQSHWMFGTRVSPPCANASSTKPRCNNRVINMAEEIEMTPIIDPNLRFAVEVIADRFCIGQYGFRFAHLIRMAHLRSTESFTPPPSPGEIPWFQRQPRS